MNTGDGDTWQDKYNTGSKKGPQQGEFNAKPWR